MDVGLTVRAREDDAGGEAVRVRVRVRVAAASVPWEASFGDGFVATFDDAPPAAAAPAAAAVAAEAPSGARAGAQPEEDDFGDFSTGSPNVSERASSFGNFESATPTVAGTAAADDDDSFGEFSEAPSPPSSTPRRGSEAAPFAQPLD